MPRAKLRESRRAGKDAFLQLIEYRLRRSLAGVKWDDTLHSLAALHNQAMATNTLFESDYDICSYDEVVSFLFRDEETPCDVMKRAFRGVPGYSSVVLNPNTKYGAIAILGNSRCFYATLLLSKKRPSVRQDAVVIEQASGSAPHNIRESDEHLISQRLPTTSASSSKPSASGSSSKPSASGSSSKPSASGSSSKPSASGSSSKEKESRKS